MRGSAQSLQQAGLGKQECAGTHAQGHLSSLILLLDPANQHGICPLAPRALSTGDENKIKIRMRAYVVMWLKQHPATTRYSPQLLRDHVHAKEAILVLAMLRRASNREDLERSTRIQHLYIIEDQNAYRDKVLLLQIHFVFILLDLNSSEGMMTP